MPGSFEVVSTICKPKLLNFLADKPTSKLTLIRKKNKLFAMKQINIGALNDSEKERALAELRTVAALRHPNIVAYRECYIDNDVLT